MPRLRRICAVYSRRHSYSWVSRRLLRKFQLKFCNYNMPNTSRRAAPPNASVNKIWHCITSCLALVVPLHNPRQPPAVIVHSIVPKIVVARWRPSCQQRRINLAAHKANYSQALIHYSCCYCIFYFQFAVYCKFGQPLWSAPGAFFCRCTITRRLLCNGFWSEAAQKTFEIFL